MYKGDQLTFPPNSKESEMMVLGCMLNTEDYFQRGCNSLTENNFVFDEHKIIFRAMKSLCQQNQPCDCYLVCSELKKENSLQKVGGAGYVLELPQIAGTSAHFEWYCDSIIEIAEKRNLINSLVQNSHKSLEEIREIVDRKLSTAIDKKTSIGTIYQYLLENSSEKKIVEEIRNTSPGIRMGMKIGDIDLEFPGGSITIVAGPTSHGKTTLLINQALGVLQHNPKKCVYFFTYEESMSAIMCLFLNTYIGKKFLKITGDQSKVFSVAGTVSMFPKKIAKFF